MSGLIGRTVLVTGASGGLGSAIATAFACDGAHVIAHCPATQSQRHLDAIGEWCHDIRQYGDNVTPMTADIEDGESIKSMFAGIADRFTALDVLVNAAGVHDDNPVARMTDEQWSRVLQINLDGVFRCCRAGTPLMPDGGRIINIASTVAQTGAYGAANYAASKAGVIGFTRSLARELARRGITANVICPGYIDAGMTHDFSESMLKRVVSRIPLQRLGNPREVASVATFLASEKAGYITGQALCVDGGLFMGG